MQVLTHLPQQHITINLKGNNELHQHPAPGSQLKNENMQLCKHLVFDSKELIFAIGQSDDAQVVCVKVSLVESYQGHVGFGSFVHG